MVADQTIRDADANAQGSTTMADLMAGLPPLLLGTYTPKIDAKGRMALPAKFRSQLGQGLVMARGQERCVYLLPFDEFRRIASQIQRVSVGNKAAPNTCVCSFPVPSTSSRTSRAACWCRRCCAITPIWVPTSW